MTEQKIQELEAAILSSNVIEGEGTHSEFVTSTHGRKVDMDLILTASELYEQWTDVISSYIQENYETQPTALIGVANGANRLAVSLATKLPNRPFGLMTEKASSKSVKLSVSVADIITQYQPEFVLVLEDVGTSGTSSLTAVKELKAAGAQHVEVLNTWQRTEKLYKLEEAGIPYRSIIKHLLPTYQPEDCEYCKAGVELIKHA